MASPAQIAAFKQNISEFRIRKQVDGKNAAMQNTFNHGLTGAGFVLSGGDEYEVALGDRETEAQCSRDGDVLNALPIRQIAMSSIRAERASGHETGLAPERMLRGGNISDHERPILVAEILAQISMDSVLMPRRLLISTEGTDALPRGLHAFRARCRPGSGVHSSWIRARWSRPSAATSLRPNG